MLNALRAREPQVYALMRIVVGLLFLCHGIQKVFGYPPFPQEAPAFIIWTAGPIELVTGALVMVGFYTRIAAFLASGTMAFAYWLAHGTHALLPIANQGELAAFYCFVFLYTAARGGGPWSVDGGGDR